MYFSSSMDEQMGSSGTPASMAGLCSLPLQQGWGWSSLLPICPGGAHKSSSHQTCLKHAVFTACRIPWLAVSSPCPFLCSPRSWIPRALCLRASRGLFCPPCSASRGLGGKQHGGSCEPASEHRNGLRLAFPCCLALLVFLPIVAKELL